MKCSVCDSEMTKKDKFCPKCGAEVLKAKGKQKEASEVKEYKLTDNEIEKLSQSFVSKDETYLASLGNSYIMNYLVDKSVKKGFSFLSNKRVYFKGSCFSGTGKRLVKTNEERTVDVKDITGTGYIYRRYIGILLGIIAMIIAIMVPFFVSFFIDNMFISRIEDSTYSEVYSISRERDMYQDKIRDIVYLIEDYEDKSEWIFDHSSFSWIEGHEEKNYLQCALENAEGMLDIINKYERLKKRNEKASYNDRYYDTWRSECEKWNANAFIIASKYEDASEWQETIEKYENEISQYKEELANFYDTEQNLVDYKDKLEEYQKLVDKCVNKQKHLENKAKFISTLSRVSVWGIAITIIVLAIVTTCIYMMRRKTYFQIEYAGGCIAFEVSFYAKAEIDDFQKQLRRAKDLAEETATIKTVAVETPVQVPTQSSVPDDLRKYADLLKEGLISQEEYDAMKKKILGL